jgi:TolA-binding protein
MRHIHEDKFQQFITKIASLYYHQRQKFLIGVGVIIIAIVALIIGISSSGKENPEVQLRFTEALGIYSVAQSAEQLDAAEERFLDFTRRFGKHYLTAKAYYYLGNISYQREEFDKASTQFEKAYGKLKNDQILGPATLFAIGNCYEEQQNLKKAAQIYEQIYNKYKKLPLAADAIIAAGRCYKVLNDFNNAERIYAQAVKELPAGETAEQAKSELAYINALKNKF